jgi:RNA polymerase sigma-70 factor (ECF subfamily)
MGYATVLVGPGDAHDVVVDAFLRVERTVGWSSVDRPGAYLMRAVRSEALNHHRTSARRRRRDLRAVLDDRASDHVGEPEVLAQIARLSVQQRSVVYLAYWEDLTEAAIADLLGVSTGTVHRTLERARARPRKALA